jgi:hypothetical protein
MIIILFDFAASLFHCTASSFRSSLNFPSTAAINSETPATTVRSPSPIHTSPKSDSLDQLTSEDEKLSFSGKSSWSLGTETVFVNN